MADRGSLEGCGVWSLGIVGICKTEVMGRHSAPGDDELDAGTDAGQGSVAVTHETREQAGGLVHERGRHSSPDDADDGPSGDDAADGSADAGGLDLIEDALHGPDSAPMPTARQPRRPAPAPPEPDARPGMELDDAPTDRIPALGDGAAERTDRIPTVASATVPDAPASRRGTIGDLGLIRRHGDVRARVIAAVVVPFLVFFAVFAVAGELTVRRLIWIWVPAVTAGVLVGLLLDAGHRRYPDAAVTESADPSTPPRTH